jgi:hypothetical protein
MPAGLTVFQDARFIKEQAADGGFMENPEIGQLFRRVVPLESGLFGPNWGTVIRNLYLPLSMSLRIKRRKAPPGDRKEVG